MQATLLGLPLYTLASYRGMGNAPRALRESGLGSVFRKSADEGDLALPPLKTDTATGSTKNMAHFIECTGKIFDKTRTINSEFIVLVGGECSITPGSLAGTRDSLGGKPGMLWLDAHGDFNTPDTSPSGYIGGMCLAMTCGRGPSLGAELESRRPLLKEDALVHVGSRALDHPEALAFSSSPAKVITAKQVRMGSASRFGKDAARHLSDNSDWVVCHLDVDVVDPSSIPAVNYPTPGGLTIDQTATLVRALLNAGKLKVLELTAYNPALDRGGASARAILGLLRKAFG